MTDKATLDDAGNVVPEPDLLVWAEWFEQNPDKRRVVLTEFDSGLRVSTVFLGLNHSWGYGPDQWFEMMAFAPKQEKEIFGRRRMIGEEMYCQRYATIEEARAGHARAVKLFTAEWGEITNEQEAN